MSKAPMHSIAVGVHRLQHVFNRKPRAADAAEELLPAVEILERPALAQPARLRRRERALAVVTFGEGVVAGRSFGPQRRLQACRRLVLAYIESAGPRHACNRGEHWRHVSDEMLALDRAVARERGFDARLVQTSMEELSMFAVGEFDLVIHPVSTCYVADVAPVFAAVARVTRPGGLYVSQHKSPTSLQATLRPERSGGNYAFAERYYREGPLPAAEPSRLREQGTLEYLHRWEQLLGGICRAGFAIEDVLEPMHAERDAEPGSFGHRAQYVAPYVRIKARRNSDATSNVRSIVFNA